MSFPTEGNTTPFTSVAIRVGDSPTLWTEYDVRKGRHKVTCDLCSQVVLLNQSGHPRSFITHRQSTKCDETVQKKKRDEENQKIKAIRESLSTGDSPNKTWMAGSQGATSTVDFTPTAGPSSLRTQDLSSPWSWRPDPIFSTPVSSQSTPITPIARLPSFTTSSTPTPSLRTSPLPREQLLGNPEDEQVTDLCDTLADLESTTVIQECRGVLVEWTPGSVWNTYPYHRHVSGSYKLPWEPIGLENDRWLRIRAEDCVGLVAGNDSAQACIVCVALPASSRFKAVMNRAISAAEHTPWIGLTHQQLDVVVRKMSGNVRQLRLRLRNAERKLSTLRRKINDHQRVCMLLATHVIQRLRRLLCVALRKGATPRALISRIEHSLEGLYRPRGGFQGRELDVAFLAKALGGPRLLYALAHSHGLPSLTTIRRELEIPRLIPSIGKPTEKEIATNISALCDIQRKLPMLLRSPHAAQVPQNSGD
ncbi:hypothetical protein C2E23DRAFT_771814, partial [Lenzites betulinus]